MTPKTVGRRSSSYHCRVVASTGPRLATATLVVGLFIAAAVAPLCAAPGGLDPSFGDGGLVLTKFAPTSFEQAFAAVIQPDGKIILAGDSSTTTDNSTSDFALARYNTDGTLDASFGNGGKVLTNFASGSGDHATAMVLQPDGKVIVAGGTVGGFALARYNGNGALDDSFGSGGLVTTKFGSGSLAMAVAIYPDGRIVAAGMSFARPGAVSPGDFALARYTASGALDPSFGAGGKVLTDFSGDSDDRALAVAIQPDGKIVAAGQSRGRFALARYNTDGTLDGSFGAAGKVLGNFPGIVSGTAYAVTVQPDGKIVVAGDVLSGTVAPAVFGVARYNADGSLDASFGSGGLVTTAFDKDAFGQALALQPGGKILVGGTTFGVDALALLARYNADGTLDADFGVGGKVTTGRLGFTSAMAVQADGKVVLAGTRFVGGFTAFAMARYLVAPPPGLFLEAHANEVVFTPGSRFDLELVVGNSGSTTNADFYFGVLLPPAAGGCPNNDPVAFFVGGFSNVVVTCLSSPSPSFGPLASGIAVPSALPFTVVPDVLTFLWSELLPAGAYTFFGAFTDTGTLDVRVLARETVTFTR